MSTHAPNTDASTAPERSLQLELFQAAKLVRTDGPRGLPRRVAQAWVSPGWWPLVASLYESYADVDDEHFQVTACHEENGVLILCARLVSANDSSAAVDIDPLVARIREEAGQTCSACGRRGAETRYVRLSDSVHVVCESCRARLMDGETFLTIADEYWRLDGTRRPKSPVVAVRLRSPGANAKHTSEDVASFSQRPGDDMIRVYQEVRARVASRVRGMHEQVSRVSLVGALHAAGGLSRGPRVLVVGPSGSGKNTLISGLKYGLESFGLPWVFSTALGLTAPGWSGAPTLNSLIQSATGNSSPNPRTVIVIDELHHARLIDGTHGTTAAHRGDVLGSIMDVAGGGVIHLGEGTAEYSCRLALVIAMGAFTDLLDYSRHSQSIGTQEIVRCGIPLELASRLTEEVIVLPTPTEEALREILRHWPALASLVGVCERMGCSVRIPDETIARAAHVVSRGHDQSTIRTAGGWIVSALRSALVAALDAGDARELVIAPDSLGISPTALRRPPNEPPDSDGGWDTTIVVRPH